MKNKYSFRKCMALVLALIMTASLLTACGSKGGAAGGASAGLEVDPASLAFPLAEKAEISGLTNFPAGSESEPNNRTIFKRLEEATNVHVTWKAIQSDQWGDKIALEMSNIKTLPEFVFNAQFGDTDLLKYAKQGVIINVEEYGDPDSGKHIVVNDDAKVISAATTDGWRKGVEWLHKLYAEGLIDPDAFTQEWSTYVAKGKSGRYGVCFSWDVANIASISMDDLIAGKGWQPLPALQADTKNITPATGSYTFGFDRGRCVVTANAKNPALICAWLDQMYAPLQSPQNNWGTYGESDDFDIFEMSTNANGEPMLKHTWLGDASPVEVREAECVGGPLAILDSYYGVYVTCPDDAQYRLDWIKNIYTPDMNTKYVYPNVFMNTDDTKRVSDLSADLNKCINTARADWIMNGFTDADWNQFQSDLQSYKLDEYLSIYQKYLDAYLG